MPCEWTEVPYCAPVCHTLLVKKPQPLIRIAGQALMIKITRMKASISAGIIAPPSPIQRMSEPLRNHRCSAEPGGRGGGDAASPPRARGADAAMRQ